MQKTVFLQSLHVILKEKISFDASQNVPSGRNSTLAITTLITLKQNSFDSSQNVSCNH